MCSLIYLLKIYNELKQKKLKQLAYPYMWELTDAAFIENHLEKRDTGENKAKPYGLG